MIETLTEFYLRLAEAQEDMPPEFARTVDKHFFELTGGDDMVEFRDEAPAPQTPIPGPAPVNEDNWAHRAKGMVCRSCMWFLPKKRTGLPASSLGRCRRHAPTMSGFPVVYTNDWCGDHKIDEERA